jgi:hypothetical protein
MLRTAESIDVFFGPIAEPDFCAAEISDHAGGVVHSAAKHIAFLHMHRPDMNSGTNLDLGMARVLLESLIEDGESVPQENASFFPSL